MTDHDPRVAPGVDPDPSVPAKAIGHPARARMLTSLMGGIHLPAGELARAAGVSKSTASEHLHILQATGMVASTTQGRHRYYRLASPAAAQAIEALLAIAPQPAANSLTHHRTTNRLREGRRCYDHLAGTLGLRITHLLQRHDIIPELTLGTPINQPDPPPSNPVAHLLGLDQPQDKRSRRPWARACLDWTERQPHVAGHVGERVATTLTELGWLDPYRDSRAVRLTATGQANLQRLERNRA